MFPFSRNRRFKEADKAVGLQTGARMELVFFLESWRKRNGLSYPECIEILEWATDQVRPGGDTNPR